MNHPVAEPPGRHARSRAARGRLPLWCVAAAFAAALALCIGLGGFRPGRAPVSAEPEAPPPVSSLPRRARTGTRTAAGR